jgi:UDP-N-acetyl-D-mannosaminuronic acid transferase (WecB/TagA/CpsF family)
MPTTSAAVDDVPVRCILGLKFFTGDAPAAVARMMRQGGLLVVPAAPALKDMVTNIAYREALIGADLAIPDSAFMVLLWNLLEKDSIRRLSGFEYLNELLRQPVFRRQHSSFWVMASAASAQRNLDWLRKQGVGLDTDDTYIAPIYGDEIEDRELLAHVQRHRPPHVVITIGGGTQERLGLYLKRNLDYRPAIHCIGAAIGFLSGDQVKLPVWADKLYLGWLFRCVWDPARYLPRYWGARKLASLLFKFRGRPPVSDP